ncbi:MAG: hypothetical protein Q7J54_04130 [Candidatus Woesearchaeota archaeon]|nr:hypothetical protein [Candidatus Woesearchaeota archaeon]
MREAIGIDYDGTIPDTNKMRALWIRKNLGINVDPWNTDETTLLKTIGKEAHKRMDAVVYERKWTLKTPPVDGAVSAIKELAKKYAPYIVTMRRPSRVESAKETLLQYGVLKYFFCIISTRPADGIKKTKEDVCRENNIGTLIDDDIMHLIDVKSDMRKILLKNGCDDRYAEQFQHNDGIELARSWDEILKKLF